MSPTALAINGIAGIALGVALVRDRRQALRGLKVAAKMTWGMLPMAAFITSLTMIGVVTLPLEMQELGRRFALLRNGLSFGAALGISFIMGAIL